MATTIVIIDDEASIRESLAGILSDEGFRPLLAEDGIRGLALLEEEAVDLVLLDIWMPGLDGLEVLKRIKESCPDLPVIMISGHGTIETAVQATRAGAYDFIEKPPSYDKIILSINNALALSRLKKDNQILREQAGRPVRLIGNSPQMVELRQLVERVAPSDAWVLIRGEHGTGKELVAQSIHALSKSAARPMIELNCAAIPEELIESELFGHEKGAFTGATSDRRGKFDLAHGGTIFLDEIGDMSLKTQAKVLRILQERKFERVGGTRTIRVDVRVLAATNKDLEEEIKKGTFRADLFYRLNVVPIEVPPLRERLSDIPLLVAEFVQENAGRGRGGKTFTPEALAALLRHSWPGNVRELRNFVERVLIMCPEPLVDGPTVERLLGLAAPPPAPPTGQPGPLPPPLPLGYREAKKAFERDFLKQRLEENGGNISQTAEQIGIERSHLHRKMKALGLDGS